jgi:hypothetical protein
MVERPDLNVNALQKLLKDALTLQERPEPLEVFWQQDTDAEEEINAAKLRYRRSCGADQERALTEFKQKTAARQELISKWESERHELQSAYDQSRGQANTMILDLVAALVTRLGPAHLSQVHLQRLKGLVANPATRGSESPGDFNLNVLNTTDTTGHPPPDELRPNEHRDTRSHPNDTSQEAIVQSAVQLDERTSTHDATQEGYGTNSGVGSKKEGQSHQSDTSVREDTAQDLHSTGAINDVEQGSINLNTVSNNSPEGPITPISLTDHVPVNGDRVSGSKRVC